MWKLIEIVLDLVVPLFREHLRRTVEGDNCNER